MKDTPLEAYQLRLDIYRDHLKAVNDDLKRVNRIANTLLITACAEIMVFVITKYWTYFIFCLFLFFAFSVVTFVVEK